MAKKRNDDSTTEETFNEQPSTEEGTFDINNPNLANYVDDDLDTDRNADEFPPPPLPGVYTMVADFHETDEDKRWRVKNDKEGKPVLSTNLKLKIIGADNPNIEERTYANRSRVKYISSRVFDGKAETTDLMKATGLLPLRGGTRPDFKGQVEAITEIVMNQIPFKVRLDWEAQGKTEHIVNGDNQPVYVQPKEFNSYAKWPKMDGKPNAEIPFTYRHEATGEEEEVMLKPQMKIVSFNPKRD